LRPNSSTLPAAFISKLLTLTIGGQATRMQRIATTEITNMSENAIVLRNVTKTFGTHTAVDDLNLTVPIGSIYGFIGPNGSGKTTTLRMVMRILHPDSGEIEVLGEHSHEAATDRIGYLPEERGLYKQMKVRDVLSYYAELKGMHKSRNAIESWLARLELTAWANKQVQTLSKGMAQKVQFIAAVVTHPELILLDEPFSGLDPVNMDVLRDAMLGLRRDGATVIFSTHDMTVAERMCDAIFMIYKGHKVLDGTLQTIQDAHGVDTIRVRLGDDSPNLHELPGVQSVTDFGQSLELRLSPGADPQRVLAVLMDRARILHFEVTRPSLHDIFVRIAQPQTEENHSA
jgi:ABC-2 type transport system ATP-binding protein